MRKILFEYYDIITIKRTIQHYYKEGDKDWKFPMIKKVNMIKGIFSSLLLAATLVLPAGAQTGQWQSYLSYHEPTEAEYGQDNTIYVLASGGLYAYNSNDRSIQTYSKVTGLNDCGIAHIAWCQAAKRLVIVYSNQNIDLLSPNDEVVNMADFQNKAMTADKTVNGIDIAGRYAYLSTGFGVLKLNVAAAEVSATYQLGFAVNYAYEENGYLYAASRTNGLYRGLMTDNLLDPANWTRVGNYTPRTKTIDEELQTTLASLSPDGPKYNYFWNMRFKNNRLYTVGGGYGHGEDTYRPGTVQVLSGDQWQIYQDHNIPELTGITYEDLNMVDADPKDPDHVMAGGKSGIYEFQNGNFVKRHWSENSPIEAFNGTDKKFQLVNTVLYDASGNLWALNSQAPTRSLLELSASGTWQTHDLQELMTLNGKSAGSLEALMMDSRNLMWFVNNHWITPAVYCFQPSTGGIKGYTSFVNQDGTYVNVGFVRNVAEDQEHNIWVATSVGPLLLSSEDIASGSDIFTQVKVPRNDGTNLADYLLSGVDVSCILVDAANRKWMGTYGNGVYCIGADNITQVYHFTTENSKLFSDNIESLAINPSTGELFIGTDKGLCSFMSNANNAGQGMTKDNVYAYPNPVRPDYVGAITITGLDNDADVKIVSANGALIEEGRASGGEYKWYGLDQQSRRVASGVYMVEVATAEGEKGVVCKIAVVN